jgi:electron transfer flavoprotein alpha subunit
LSALVFLEHHDGELQKDSLGVLGKAAQLGGEVSALIAGSGIEALAQQAARFGAAKVYIADDPALEAPLPQPRVDVVADLVRRQGFETVLFAATVLTADVAAALSARLDAGLIWELVDLMLEGGMVVGKRPALDDSVYVDVGW